MKFGGLLPWEPPVEKIAEAVREFLCGVPDCRDGVVVLQDEVATVVECSTHNARTTHDTNPIKRGIQNVIRVQDAWRQHGTQPPPGRK